MNRFIETNRSKRRIDERSDFIGEYIELAKKFNMLVTDVKIKKDGMIWFNIYDGEFDKKTKIGVMLK